MGTIYETRLRFIGFDDDAASRLDRIVDTLADLDTKSTLARILSLIADTASLPRTPTVSRNFIICHLVGATWDLERVTDRKLPADGLLLPGSLSNRSIEEICQLYVNAPIDLRSLIRIVVDANLGPVPQQAPDRVNRATDPTRSRTAHR